MTTVLTRGCCAAMIVGGFAAVASGQEPPVSAEILDGGLEPEGLPIQDHEAATSEQAAAPRPDNTPLDPAAKGFISIPGTEARLKLGGLVRLMLVSTSKAVGQQDQWFPSTIPVAGQSNSMSGEQFNVNANQSRLNLDFRVPTVAGDLRAYYENDFSGTTDQSFVYHIRYFYVQVANVLAGWTDSTLVDVDAAAETLDPQGPNAAVKLKHAVARYTVVLNRRRGSLSTIGFAFEQPGSEIPSSIGPPRSVAPDAVVSWRLEGRRGHLQLAGLARAIGYQNSTTGAGQTVFGWAVNLTGDLSVFGRDHLSAQIAYGHGAAAYFADTAGGGYDAALDATGQLTAVPILGTFAAYTHHWSAAFRSSVSYGYLALNPSSVGVSLATTSFQRSQYASANLIWKWGPRFFLGIEGLYGYLHVVSPDSGEAYRAQLNAQYNF
jgi:DcaP outer membrane protein